MLYDVYSYGDLASLYDELLVRAKVPSLKIKRELVILKQVKYCKYNSRYSYIVAMSRAYYGKNSFKSTATIGKFYLMTMMTLEQNANFSQFRHSLK